MEHQTLMDAAYYIASGALIAMIGYYSLALSKYSGEPIEVDDSRTSGLEKSLEG